MLLLTATGFVPDRTAFGLLGSKASFFEIPFAAGDFLSIFNVAVLPFGLAGFSIIAGLCLSRRG